MSRNFFTKTIHPLLIILAALTTLSACSGGSNNGPSSLSNNSSIISSITSNSSLSSNINQSSLLSSASSISSDINTSSVASSTVSSPPTTSSTSSANPSAQDGSGYDNPWVGNNYYVDPGWSARAAAEPGGEAIADYNTAVWMDRIGAITDGIGLKGHLDNALLQDVDTFMFVVYDLPNRDCAALASNGELRISEGGFERYQDEYIDEIASIVSDPAYQRLRIVAIIEVDSLPNLVTNAGGGDGTRVFEDCVEAKGPGGYVDGVQYALGKLSEIPNVYSYVDIAHSGWLGWASNFGPSVDLIFDTINDSPNGWQGVAGFVSNSANYTPVQEPYLPDPDLKFGGGLPIKSSNFYEWNPYFEELKFSLDWRDAMISKGAPASIGMLIDTSRNGWGGPERPVARSRSQNIETHVNESRVDRRFHRGNWCNQEGGVGFRPQANPHPGIDAFVWVKPQGESDGVSDPNFTQDPNDQAKRHDGMCDPNANNTSNTSVKTGAMANGPHAGRWFPEAFRVLLSNAYPPLDQTGPADLSPPEPPQDCPGALASAPLALTPGADDLDLFCEVVHVTFSGPVSRLELRAVQNEEFNVVLEYNGRSQSESGHYSNTNINETINGIMTITRQAGGANTVRVEWQSASQ